MRPNVPRVVTSGDVPARQPPKAPPKKKQPASSKHKQAPNPTQQKTHQAESVVLFANPANDGRPICLLCFARRLAAITDPAERAAWSIKEQDARAAWAVLGASGKPMKVSIPASDGWLFLLLTEQKWTRISKKRQRCWDCCERLALAYRQIVEEERGAPGARNYAQQCKTAAEAAALLALEMEANDYRPTGLAIQLDELLGDLRDRLLKHIETLRAIQTEPSEAMARVLWRDCVRRLADIAKGMAPDASSEQVRYEPLIAGSEPVRAVAVALRKTSLLASYTHHSFAGVVDAHASDPSNPPQRMALVKAYQWAQTEWTPPMGYRELAAVLIEHGAADSMWGGDKMALAESIKKAVKTHRSDGDIPSMTYAPPKVGSTPPQN